MQGYVNASRVLPKLLSTKSCSISIILNRKLTCYINYSNHNLYTRFTKPILTIIFGLFTEPQWPTEFIINKNSNTRPDLLTYLLLIHVTSWDQDLFAVNGSETLEGFLHKMWSSH